MFLCATVWFYKIGLTLLQNPVTVIQRPHFNRGVYIVPNEMGRCPQRVSNLDLKGISPVLL